MSQLLRRWAVCLGALCHAVGVSAAVIVVPVDQPTIQQAVDAATDGDEIVLMPGAYAENVEIPGLSLTIRSTDPGDPVVVASTTVERVSVGSTIRYSPDGSVPGPSLAIEGLSFPSAAPFAGQVFLCESTSSVVFENCTFGQGVGVVGRGMIVASCDAALVGCSFRGFSTTSGSTSFGLLIATGDTTLDMAGCTVEGCASAGGSLISLDAQTTATAHGCDFLNNDAAVLYAGCSSEFEFSGCTFEGNTTDALDSGACYGGTAFSDGEFIDCVFRGNHAPQGGAFWQTDSSALTLIDCLIEMNTSGGEGGAYWHRDQCSVTVRGCVVTGNTANGHGGAFFCEGESGGISVRDSEFRSNISNAGMGGAVYVSDCGSGSSLRSLFEGNSATGSGGAVAAPGASLTVRDCALIENEAGDRGGAVFYVGGQPTEAVSLRVLRSRFARNMSTNEGGAVYSDADDFFGPFSQSVVRYESCEFFENESGADGGAIWNKAETLGGTQPFRTLLTNCTLVGNTASGVGGGYLNASNFEPGSLTIVQNNILWKNTPDQIVDDGFAGRLSERSIIQGASLGAGIQDVDPMFVDEAGGDFRLLPGSPAIDTGTNFPVTSETDLDGNPRIVNTDVDMGAYEFQGVPGCAGDCDSNGIVDFGDLVSLVFLFGATDQGVCDADGSGVIGFGDLVATLFVFGPCEGG